MINLSSMINDLSEKKETPIPIVLFGSSNTALNYGSGGRLTWGEWFSINLRMSKGPQFKVINSGIGGDTTVDLLKRIDRDVLFYQPKFVILTIGGNDCSKDLGIENYKNNLKILIDKISKQGALTILQTYYCFDYKAFNSKVPGKDERIIREFPLYMDALREIAKELNLPLIDEYLYFEPLYRKDRDTYKNLMIDSMHVNYIGNFILGNNVSKAFGLHDLEIPEDIKEDITFYINKLEELS